MQSSLDHLRSCNRMVKVTPSTAPTTLPHRIPGPFEKAFKTLKLLRQNKFSDFTFRGPLPAEGFLACSCSPINVRRQDVQPYDQSYDCIIAAICSNRKAKQAKKSLTMEAHKKHVKFWSFGVERRPGPPKDVAPTSSIDFTNGTTSPCDRNHQTVP